MGMALDQDAAQDPEIAAHNPSSLTHRYPIFQQLETLKSLAEGRTWAALDFETARFSGFLKLHYKQFHGEASGSSRCSAGFVR